MPLTSQNRSWFSRLNPFACRAKQISSRRSIASRPSFRPSLETLEDRFMPSVDFNGGPVISNVNNGPVIPNVQVNTLFLGQEWVSSSTNTLGGLAQGLNGYLGTLVNSPYMDMLAQYNVGRGSFGSTCWEWSNNDPNMQSPMDDDHTSSHGLTELQSLIVTAIQQGYLAAPNTNQLYVVFLPPGEQVTGRYGYVNNDPSNGFFGYHNSFNSSQYGTIHYAVLPFPGGPQSTEPGVRTAFDSLTETISHELSEAVTDPILGQGWVDPQNGNEIGDVVNTQSVYWNGYVVQKEANQQGGGMTPNLPCTAVSIAATANQAFSGTVMSFTDNSTTVFGDTPIQSLGGSALPGSSFTVTINWGDGQTSGGQVVYNGNGQYSVVGSHAYAQAGLYQVSVLVTDEWSVDASANSTVTVSSSPPVQSSPQLPSSPPSPYDELATDALNLVQSFEAGNLGGVFAALMDYENVLSQANGASPAALQQAFISDIMGDLF